jgi:phytoene dehydrogenase-like protein
MGKYDIAIIGSGLGGLECGAILSKEGYKVCVLEKNPLYGGCFQSFKRKGHLLDTGMHYIGSMEKGQLMYQILTYLGIYDKIKLRKLDNTAFDIINYNGKEYKYATGHKAFIESLSNDFPEQRANLTKYVNFLEKIGKLVSVELLKEGKLSEGALDLMSISAYETIKEMIGDEDLQQIIAGTSLLYGGDKERTTFYHHAMVTNSYLEGSYRFVDGSMQVADALVAQIRDNGGDVFNNKEVTSIKMEDDLVSCLEVNNEELFYADNFISDVHPSITLDILEKNKVIKKAFKTRINSLVNTYSVFTTYLIMKPNKCKYRNSNIYLHRDKDLWYDESKTGTYSCMLSFQANSKNEEFVDVISILVPMQMSEVEEYSDTKCNNRGAGYEAFKEKKSQEVISFVNKYHPEIVENIESVFTTSPLSYRDYTATLNGTAYGIIKDHKAIYKSLLSPRTKINNLFLTGQNLNVHGAMGVSVTALYTCAEFLGEEYLAKKVGGAL